MLPFMKNEILKCALVSFAAVAFVGILVSMLGYMKLKYYQPIRQQCITSGKKWECIHRPHRFGRCFCKDQSVDNKR